MEFKYVEHSKYLILALVGLIMACLGLLTYLFHPLDLIVDSVSTLRPGTLLFNLWAEPPLELLTKIYVFNITNPQEFLAGKEKLRVQEVGPYTYREHLRNMDGVLNENGTITYRPSREYVFKLEHSVGDVELDTVLVPNVPLLGIGSLVTEFNTFINFGYNMMTGDAKQFLNLTVQEYMWGYDDSLVKMASTFIPTWIDFPRFGIMDRLTTLDDGNTVTIFTTGNEDDPDNPVLAYGIDKLNGSPGLKFWGYENVGENKTSEANTKCNTVRGRYDGGLFPKRLKENSTLGMYRHAFCRPVDLLYENTSTSIDGFKVYNYRVNQNFLQSGKENPDNECYCQKGVCLPNGFNTLAPCYYGVPITISQPHYLNADTRILDQVEGLHPDRDKHDSTAQVNPNFGIPVSGKMRIQINLNIGESRIQTKLKPFNNLMIPLCWFELEIRGPTPTLKFILHMAINVAPICQDVIMWLLGILGLSMIAVSALIIFYFAPERRLEDPFHRIGYSPILVIPLSSRLKPDMRIS